MNHHRLLSFAVFFVALLISPLAVAQPTTPTSDANSARADELAHRGVDLLKKHQWAEAEEVFRQALALKRSYDIVGNLGLAEAGLGKWRDATEHLTFALSTFPANGKPSHRDLLKEKLASTREHVCALTIEVDLAAAEVLVDGKGVGTAPLTDEVFVEPGVHVVEARLAGRDAARQQATVAAGASASVKLVLPVPRTPPPAPQLPSRGPSTALLVAGGVTTGVALVVGTGLAIASKTKASSASTDFASLVMQRGPAACAQQTAPGCQELHDAIAAKSALGSAAAWTFVGGGVVGVTTLVYGLAAPRTPARSGVVVAPIVGASEGGFVIRGVW
jgi:hypothetical protein